MYARAAAATTAALLGAGALALPSTAAAQTPADARVAHKSGTSLAHKDPTVVAHRGASAYAPENTLAAIDKAAWMGFRWVENDVQRTKDGVLVIVHDDNLKRTTNVEEVFPDRAPWKVKDFTAAEIAKLDAGSWFGEKYEGARVPTLTQYMNRVSRNHQSLVLEIKKPELYPGIEKDTLRVLRKTGWLDHHHVKNKLVVQSFSADSVKKVHALRPDVKTGFLGTPAAADLPTYAEFSDQINSTHTSISADYVSAIHRLKGAHGKRLEIFTWTVDEAAAARRAAGFGVDGIITNKPDVVRQALRD
ncbi:glycerophosphodiester phosphodiesterase family protein [Streptomyces aurantiacus]|uniref:Putative glycerophosphoryl diester phosphodiesterase YhdW n=1 Tax=Streptomyces aurantiacus JA 4570 TaxID=1286094 RepID=S3ZTM1_9ACTN|nr:glycerophosphodiester phosphodiesterase family protein [Streptomyces aurantiacus]EPH41770.1 putative glycerophosphoryl diester phosphodiesterase YhdW [Streptomyces aurantiacus JA 4570]